MRATLLLGLLVAAAPLAAHAGPSPVGLLREDFAGDFWHAARVQVGPGGARVTVEVAFTGPGQAFGTAAFWVVAPDGTARGGGVVAVGGNHVEIHVEAGLTGVLLHHEEAPFQGTSRVASAADLAEGAHTLVTLAAMDGGAVPRTLRITAEGPVAVLATSRGDDAWLWRESDFGGSTNVQSALPGPADAQARVIHQGSQGLTAQHSLFAQFVGMASGPMDLAVFVPEGVLEGQDFYDLGNAGHGSYQFLVRSLADARAPHPACAGLGACQGPAVWALVGDVALP